MDRAKAADRINKLRAKADSTSFPAEAESLRAKADDLARLYGVDDFASRRPWSDPESDPMGDFLSWGDLYGINLRNMRGARFNGGTVSATTNFTVTVNGHTLHNVRIGNVGMST